MITDDPTFTGLTMDDFMRTILTAWPNGVVEEDSDTGELIVRTGVRLHGDDILELDSEHL